MLFSSVLAAAVALLAPALTEAYGIKKNDCYDTLEGFVHGFNEQWQAASACSTHCVPLGKPVMAINGSDCWCADTLPPKKHKVDLSLCSMKCPGYGTDMCGSENGAYFSTWNDGLAETIKNADSVADNAPSSKTSQAAETTANSPSVVTNFVGGQTVIVTRSPEASKDTGSSGPNVAGIAAGVVVGVVAIAAAIGGMWFFLRARNRRELEDAHRRQAAINAFVKSPSDAPAFDTRLEPAIMRRMSAGSIADNQDYSRRILKVTNA
ncbi:hypothetical protein VC83_07206 [Pseudogymnoascus destructans]|uniref:WSC domain-containing protein n=2 Tax=Pseudogymnoascus destructans TaxID=655981 RepID=L8FR19_PSED2|nr:uncharacterized protein VC83_07206 [Pseudogymnoascus destructans]ELR03430.1 hypothetical protein GMDG_06165 [Pseudogymnoascus destructans 20631-21]OAF56634.1 hypothetical protein VC83_07206 [Pseudogymnoascus destructans]